MCLFGSILSKNASILLAGITDFQSFSIEREIKIDLKWP